MLDLSIPTLRGLSGLAFLVALYLVGVQESPWFLVVMIAAWILDKWADQGQKRAELEELEAELENVVLALARQPLDDLVDDVPPYDYEWATITTQDQK